MTRELFIYCAKLLSVNTIQKQLKFNINGNNLTQIKSNYRDINLIIAFQYFSINYQKCSPSPASLSSPQSSSSSEPTVAFSTISISIWCISF